MNIIIPSIFTLAIASTIIVSIVSRFSGSTLFLLALVSLVIILYNNITMFGNEYIFFLDFFETFGGRVLFVLIIGAILFVVLSFISKMNIVKTQALKVFASSKSNTNIPIERILQIERQL